MKKLITIIITIILAISMAACEASGIPDTTTGKVQPIEDYHVTTGWYECGVIATPDGHYWECDMGDYRGYVEVAYDGLGDKNPKNDVLILALPED